MTCAVSDHCGSVAASPLALLCSALLSAEADLALALPASLHERPRGIAHHGEHHAAIICERIDSEQQQ